MCLEPESGAHTNNVMGAQNMTRKCSRAVTLAHLCAAAAVPVKLAEHDRTEQISTYPLAVDGMLNIFLVSDSERDNSAHPGCRICARLVVNTDVRHYGQLESQS